MHGQQLRVARRAARTRVPARVGVAEGRERERVEAPYAAGTRARACAGFGGGAVVEAAHALPAGLGTREDDGLAVVARSDEGVFGGPSEGDEGEGRDADVVDCGAVGIDDADGTVVACTVCEI